MPRRTRTVAEQFIEVLHRPASSGSTGSSATASTRSSTPCAAPTGSSGSTSTTRRRRRSRPARRRSSPAGWRCAPGAPGPGNTHLVQGLYDAHRSGAPVLALASHIPSAQIGTGFFQETHPEQLFAECSHYCELVGQPQQMPRVLRIAIQHALGRGGVAVVVMPGDVRTVRPRTRPGRARWAARARAVCRPQAQVEALADALNRAAHRDAVRRRRGARRARRGDAARREGAGAGRPRARRQGVDPVRQPLRRRHERAARLRRLPRGHPRGRPAGPARHRLPLRQLPARGPGRAGGPRPDQARAAHRRSTSA